VRPGEEGVPEGSWKDTAGSRKREVKPKTRESQEERSEKI